MTTKLEVIYDVLKKCIPNYFKKLLIIYDDSTISLIDFFTEAAIKLGKEVSICKIKISECHGSEPALKVSHMMLRSEVIVCITKYSLAHTRARYQAESSGIPFLSMPGYNHDMLENPAFGVNYLSRSCVVKKYCKLLTNGRSLRIISNTGTDIIVNLEARKGNYCPGFVSRDMLLGSPPDIEANIAPLEECSYGKIVVDGSVTAEGLGLLQEHISLEIENGYIKKATSTNKKYVDIFCSMFENVKNNNCKILAEVGFGFNNCAEICGNMLIDEGAQGTVHFGFGSNWTIGGVNKVDFHVDCIIKRPTVYLDDIIIMEEGKVVYDTIS